MELIISDLEQVDKNITSTVKKASVTKEKKAVATASALTKIKAALDAGILIYDIRDQLTLEEQQAIKNYNFLTNKSFIYALNIGQDDLSQAPRIQEEYAKIIGKPVAIVCAALESEMITFSESEKKEFLEMMIESTNSEDIPTLDDLISLAFQEL